jgi:Tfp pilus assembly protein PilN
MRLRDPELTNLPKLYVTDLTGTLADCSEYPQLARLPRSAAVSLPSEPRCQFDFRARAAPVTGWRLGLLIAGVACGVLGAAEEFSGYREAATLREEISLSAPALDMEAATHSRTEPQRSRPQIRAVNQAITSLNLPVGVLLQTLQPPGELHTALLGLDLSDVQGDTRTASVKITAESRSALEMTSYVDLLSHSGLFDSVFLIRHEVEATRAEHPYRYIVEASWKQ